MAVVVPVVAMVPSPPFIDRHDRVLGNWRSERVIPAASIFKVMALNERTSEPVDCKEDKGDPKRDAEAQEQPAHWFEDYNCWVVHC